MKYHIKPLGTAKTKGFCQNLYGWDLFLHPVKITWAVQWYDFELKINESRYIALFMVSGSTKKLFSIDCVNIYFSQSIVFSQ